MNINDTIPLISVILPVRNSSRFLTSSITSILTQNYKNIEIIAIDDFSTDRSWKVLSSLKKLDKRIKTYRNVKKYGLAITLNRALKRAKGQFVAFMDPRDMVTKNKFQKQVDYLQNNPKVVAVGTQCMYLNEEDKRIGKSKFPPLHEHISQKPLHGVSVLFEGIMVNKLAIPKDLLYFPPNKHLFLYSDMAMKLLQFGELANIDEYLHLHRKHNGSLESTQHIFSMLKLWISSQMQYDVDLPFRTFFAGALKPLFS